MNLRLWLIRETDLARLYSKTNPDDPSRTPDTLWIPRSIVEHTTKRGNEHIVKLPDWWIEKMEKEKL